MSALFTFGQINSRRINRPGSSGVKTRTGRRKTPDQNTPHNTSRIHTPLNGDRKEDKIMDIICSKCGKKIPLSQACVCDKCGEIVCAKCAEKSFYYCSGCSGNYKGLNWSYNRKFFQSVFMEYRFVRARDTEPETLSARKHRPCAKPQVAFQARTWSRSLIVLCRKASVHISDP